tara:strand:- start:411 stop:599 length:189 start_codon:yes stop_codon:yes gene_type:complete
MNSTSYLNEKLAKQSLRIDRLRRDMSAMQTQMDKLMGDNFQVYLDQAIRDGVANYEIKELIG